MSVFRVIVVPYELGRLRDGVGRGRNGCSRRAPPRRPARPVARSRRRRWSSRALLERGQHKLRSDAAGIGAGPGRARGRRLPGHPVGQPLRSGRCDGRPRRAGTGCRLARRARGLQHAQVDGVRLLRRHGPGHPHGRSLALDARSPARRRAGSRGGGRARGRPRPRRERAHAPARVADHARASRGAHGAPGRWRRSSRCCRRASTCTSISTCSTPRMVASTSTALPAACGQVISMRSSSSCSSACRCGRLAHRLRPGGRPDGRVPPIALGLLRRLAAASG